MNEPGWELALSTALDGELEAVPARALLDAMAADPACRERWRQLRALDRQLRPLRRPATAPLVPAARGRRLRWLVPVAAAALLSFLLLREAPLRPGGLPDPQAGPLTVRLETDGGRMTEARFVELVVEVLQADQRYQDKMREVLEEVRPAATLAEAGSPETAAPRAGRLAFERSAARAPGSGELPFSAAAGIH